MARRIWTGTVNFGLVSIPVAMYSATQDHTVHFHQYQRGTRDRIRYKRVNERTGKEIDYDDIVKGREIGDDLVLVETDELDAVAPGRSRTIDIDVFVELDQIDPIHFNRTYWLGPGKKEGERPYALLVEAMAETRRAGVCSFVMRNKEYLGAIRADGAVLALDTLFFADEVRRAADVVGDVPEVGKARGKEAEMAVSLVDSMAGEWRPEDYRDTYTERVEQLLKDKHAGRETPPAEEPPEETNVVDLVDVLQRSVEDAKRSRSGGKQPASARLKDLTKSELNRMAREVGIRGRSKMSRDELEKAVEAAGRERAAS